jgi:hypothetical protein
VKARTGIPILLLSVFVCVGFCQSAPETQKNQMELTGVVLASGHRCFETRVQEDLLCRSSDWALASETTTYLLYGDVPTLKKFEHKRAKIVGSLEEEPLVWYGQHVIRRKLFVSSIEAAELSENEIERLVRELKDAPWRGPENYTSPAWWDFAFTDPMKKILQAGHLAQDVLLRHLGDHDVQDQVIMLLGGVGDEDAIGPIIEAMADNSGPMLAAQAKRINLAANLALTNLTVSDVIWSQRGGVPFDNCPDAPKLCWSKWWGAHNDTFRVGVAGNQLNTNYPSYGIYAQFGDFQ